jgi:hypothetical protein
VRATSGLCAFYSGLLFVLVNDVRREARVISYQAVRMMGIALVGTAAGQSVTGSIGLLRENDVGQIFVPYATSFWQALRRIKQFPRPR